MRTSLSWIGRISPLMRRLTSCQARQSSWPLVCALHLIASRSHRLTTELLLTYQSLPPISSLIACAVPGGPKTLDFAGVTRLLNIMGDGTLEVNGLNIRGMASRHLLGAAVIPNLRAVGFAFWPTIIAQPNAKV